MNNTPEKPLELEIEDGTKKETDGAKKPAPKRRYSRKKATPKKKPAPAEIVPTPEPQEEPAPPPASDEAAPKRPSRRKRTAKNKQEAKETKETPAKKASSKKQAAEERSDEAALPPEVAETAPPEAPEPVAVVEATPDEGAPKADAAPRPRPRRRRKSEASTALTAEERSNLNREILVSAARDETRVATVENGAVVEFYVERPSTQKIAGSIFLGRATNVLPGMQAAFIDIGEEKNAFLYVDDALLPPSVEDADGAPPVPRSKRRSITELVKQGQDVMVQVVKEAIGTKGARVTRHVTFPGRYLVLMPTVSYVGVSRRIGDEEERSRLRAIAKTLKPKDMGIIIRTVAENKDEEELRRDLDFLLKVWEKVQKRVGSSKAPQLIHQDLGLVFRVVRDELNQDTTRMLVDDVHTYGKILDLLDSVSPEMKDKVMFYRDREYPLFQLYGVDAAIDKALQRQVWLKSGGYLVFDRTEALTVIDVNTGRYVGTKNLADTVFRTNMEACEEISRQLRLRDLGGIIVVDFIDMDVHAHRQQLLDHLEHCLKQDHTKTVVVGLTGLGLVEMTRKKVRQSIDATMMRTCPYCGGKGTVMSEETVAARVRREIRRVLQNSHCEAILVETNPSVASHLIGPGGDNLKDLEKETGRSIFIRGADPLHLEEMNVKAIGKRDEIADKAMPVHVGEVYELTIEEPHEKSSLDGIARREGYVINIEGAGTRIGQKVMVEITGRQRTSAKGKIVEC